MLIVLRENQLCKTSTRHWKNSEQSGIAAIDSCGFALFGARQYGATIRENYDEKYPRTLILSPDQELSTPTKSRHTTCLVQVSSWCQVVDENKKGETAVYGSSMQLKGLLREPYKIV